MPSFLPPISAAARHHAAVTKTGVSLLVWHDIVPKSRDKIVWFDTSVAQFEDQLARLEHAGARPIALPALLNYLSPGTPIPPPGAVVLCFDDNTAGIATYAAPRLARRGWPWVLSAHTEYVGVTTGKPHNDWATLRAMERQGATIVSQTHTHPPDLRTLSDTALGHEMIESRNLMERELQHPVRFVTYPSGKWDRRVALAAASAGYRMGLTEDFGAAETSPHLLGIHRYSTHRRWDEALAAVRRSAGR